MKEIMNEWRRYVKKEVVAEGTQQVMTRATLTLAGSIMPSIANKLGIIKNQFISIGLKAEEAETAISNIVQAFVELAGPAFSKSSFFKEWVLKLFDLLVRMGPNAVSTLVQISKIVASKPFIILSIVMDLKTIYEQVMILIKEIDRSSTVAATDHGNKMAALLRIREYDNLIKQQGYTNVFGQFDRKQYNSLKSVFNTAKQFVPSVVEFNPTVYKLITDFEKQSAPGQPLQPPEIEY